MLTVRELLAGVDLRAGGRRGGARCAGGDLGWARDRVELWLALRGREIVNRPSTYSEVLQ